MAMFAPLISLAYGFLETLKTWVSLCLFFFLGAGFQGLGLGILFYGVYPLNNVYGLLVLALIFLYAFGYIYVWVHAWRGLVMETRSFFLALGHSLLVISWVLGFLRGLQGTLYLEDLPAHSFYRYLLSFFFCLGLLLPWASILPQTHFFYAFLGSWGENPLNKFSHFLAPYVAYAGLRWFLVFFHFLGLCLWPLAQVGVFLLGIVLWQDLSYFLLSLPLSLGTWVYGLVYDYFSTFVRENLVSLRPYLRVEKQGKDLSRGSLWLEVRNRDLSFELTPWARTQGLSLDRLEILWYHLATSDGFLRWLEERSFFFYFSRWVLFLRWLGLAYVCSFLYPGPESSLGFFASVSRPITIVFKPLGPSAAQAHFCTGNKPGIYSITKELASHVQGQSQGAWNQDQGRHMVITDPSKVSHSGEVPVYATLTKGQGTHEISSQKLCSRLPQGSSQEQKAIPWKDNAVISVHALEKVLPGSEAYLELSETDQNLRKMSSSYERDNPRTQASSTAENSSSASASSTPGSSSSGSSSSSWVDP